MCNEWQSFLSQLHNRSDEKGGGSDAKKSKNLRGFYETLMTRTKKTDPKAPEGKKPSA